MATAARKNVKRPAKKATPKSTRTKVRQLSWFDRILRTLPFSESDIQRIFTWGVIAAMIGVVVVIAMYLGLPKKAYAQYADLAAKAGLEVKDIEVVGMERVDQAAVYKIVLSEMDRSMPLVDIEKIRSDLLKYGWIEDVRVSRRLPDTLMVEITERKPSAIWQRGGKASLIDEKGIVLESVSVSGVKGLPILYGEGANAQTVALSELMAQAPSLKSQIIAASWVGNRRWDLKFKTGETLALPEGEKLAADALLNFARMDGIHRLLGRDIIHFDLRDPERAYFRKAPKLEASPKDDKKTVDKNTGDKGSGKKSSEDGNDGEPV